MFDVGFSELGVIGLVALIVIGPEQLPRVARTAGHLMGRLRRYVSDIKSDISREMELADLQRLSDEVKDSARSMESSIREHVAGIESEVHQSIASPEAYLLSEPPVVTASSVVHESDPAQGASSDHQPVHADTARAAEAAAAETEFPVDPNQMDMFGRPPAAHGPSPEKN